MKGWLEEVEVYDLVNIKRAMRRKEVTMSDIARVWGYKRRETAGRKLRSGKMSTKQMLKLARLLGYTKVIFK